MKKYKKLISFLVVCLSFAIVVCINRFTNYYVYKHFGLNHKDAQFIGLLCLASFLVGAIMMFVINLIEKKY